MFPLVLHAATRIHLLVDLQHVLLRFKTLLVHFVLLDVRWLLLELRKFLLELLNLITFLGDQFILLQLDFLVALPLIQNILHLDFDSHQFIFSLNHLLLLLDLFANEIQAFKLYIAHVQVGNVLGFAFDHLV